MDAFEDLIGGLLRNDGYWVESSYKVNLTKSEKLDIGRASSPRWEIDLIAYKARTNELLVVECKSFLDSKGVCASSFCEGIKPDRYKLFNEQRLREVVFSRLTEQLLNAGSIRDNPDVQLCLAAGQIKSDRDRENIKAIFSEKGWRLFDEAWVRAEIKELSRGSYQNSVASVVSKMIIRGQGF